MAYQTKRNLKNPNLLEPEEEDVLDAVKDYTDDPAVVTSDDFMPVEWLYERYLRTPHNYETLVLPQFGTAILRLFPNLAEREPHRVQRTVDGKRITGYVGLKGPLSLSIVAKKGRRWKRTDQQSN